MFLSLDFIYLPAPDFEATLRHYTEGLGGELVWRVRGMGTVVAMVRLSVSGPALLIAEHLEGQSPILVYRVEDYEQAVAKLEAQGLSGTRLEIPHGPCFSFVLPIGQRFAIYQLVRPEANEYFKGRMDR